MPATITIVCPECDKEMKAPANAEGKKVRCKGCDAIFVARPDVDELEELEELPEKPKKKPAAKKPAPPPPPAKKPGRSDLDAEEGAYGMTFEDLSNRCPECANLMDSEDAIICLYCGFNTESRERRKTRKVRDQTGWDVFFWLLPGIACALAVILMITWIVIHWGPLEGWLGLDMTKDSDKESWTGTSVALYTKLWTTIPLLYLIYSAGKFAIVRLAIKYKPPEIEEKLGK